MNDKKVAIIVWSEEEQYCEECLYYLEKLKIPKAYSLELFVVKDSESMRAGYAEGMRATNAKYKLYLSDRVFILQQNFVERAIEVFEGNENIGIMSVLGASKESIDTGKAIVSVNNNTHLVDYQTTCDELYCVKGVAVECIFSQYDVDWENAREKNGCFFWEKEDYLFGVFHQKMAWCQIEKHKTIVMGDRINVSQDILNNIVEICKREQEKNTCIFYQKNTMKSLIEKYNYIKFMLRRLQYDAPKEDCDMFIGDYFDGHISSAAIEIILEHEILYKRRVVTTINNWRKVSHLNAVCDEVEANINVVSSINRKYVAPLCVMLQSLYENSGRAHINVYVLHSELSDADKEIICSHADENNASVEFLRVDARWFEGLPITNTWTVEALFRLSMIQLLPKEIDRVLYLDVDTLVLNSITDFYFSDFEGNDVIACKDMGSSIPFGDGRDELFKEYIDKEEFTYFCSGVTLWNIKELRDRIGLEKYINVAKMVDYRIVAPDQDLINLVHHGRIKRVNELKYGCFVKGYGWCEDEVRRCVSILHYAGPKPWNNVIRIEPTYDLWWEYAKKTPQYMELLEGLREEVYKVMRRIKW